MFKVNILEEFNNKNEYFLITSDEVRYLFKYLSNNFIKDNNTFRVLINTVNFILHSVDIQELGEIKKDMNKLTKFITNNINFKIFLDNNNEIRSYEFTIYITLLVKLLVEKIISFNLFLSKKPNNSKTRLCYIITKYTDVSITLEKFNIFELGY